MPAQPVGTVPPLTETTAQSILTKQDELIANLNLLLTDQMQIESFENINEGSILLNPETYPEVSDYAYVYNQNIALLDDPRNMINASFNTYLNIQNKKISNLRSELNQLQNNIQKNKQDAVPIKGFKSMNNSQILNVEPYNGAIQYPNKYTSTKPINHNFQENGATQYPNYLIYGNNGCLQYEPSVNTNIIDIYGNNKIIPASWAFKPCNSNEPRQQFVSTQVNDLQTYNSFIAEDYNKNSKLRTSKTTTFGFNVVNPINTQDQCLQLNNDGLSVMPCNLEFEQRFRPVYSTVLP